MTDALLLSLTAALTWFLWLALETWGDAAMAWAWAWAMWVVVLARSLL